MALPTFGKKYIAALIAENDVKSFVRQGDISHLFKGNEVELYEFVTQHFQQHHALPQASTIKAHTGETLPAFEEPPSYYLKYMQRRHIEVLLKKGMQEAAKFLGVENKDPDEAFRLMQETITQLTIKQHGNRISDFRDARPLLMAEYKQTMTEEGTGIMMGWPALDESTNGVSAGDLISYVGRPAAGKTWQLLYSAHHAWAEQKKVPLFVSMEMNPVQIHQRLGSMHSHVPIGLIKKGDLSTIYLKRYKGALSGASLAGVPFWVVDGNLSSTVDDIERLAGHLKPDVIYIDGAYLLKHPKERDRFKRVAENADLIKQNLCGERPVVCSWQFKRGDGKKKKDQGNTLDDIGYTDAIAQVSSLVLGLTQEDTVETAETRKVEILKGRHGETGSFTLNWDFLKMDFSEVVQEALSDIQFS